MGETEGGDGTLLPYGHSPSTHRDAVIRTQWASHPTQV